MDDPWANAWGEPTNSVLGATTTTTWPTSPVGTNSSDDQEADIGLPSWATGAGIQWTQSSIPETPLWDNPASVKAWDASPYDNIPIGQPSLDQSAQSSSPESPGPKPSPPSPLPSPTDELPSPFSVSPIEQPYSPPTAIETESVPGSPDAFGTFETGLDVDETDVDPWSPPRTNLVSADSDTWGAPWEPTPNFNTGIQETEKSEPVDEWEAAKQQKEIQDRHVPPELLASILSQFGELSANLWPDSSLPKSDDTKPDLTDNQRSGIDGIEGLTAVVERLIPKDLILPSNPPFSKTFTSKHVGDTLRLTRHAPITRMSPLALYMATKGSTAWEASVKSRPEVVQDDVLPPGWRVLEKDKDKEELSPANDGNKKKPNGGLLSFFGRRASTPIEGGKTDRSASPVRTPSQPGPSSPTTRSSSPRSSMDSSKSRSTITTRSSTPTMPPIPIVSLAPASSAVSSDPVSAPISNPQAEIVREPSPPPPSAVSRFLNRFSRTKSSGGSNPRNSLALSSDDLEFLSDIVPSASDDPDESVQLRALSNLIASSPLSTKLPPPLAPPPRAPLPPLRTPSFRPSSSTTPLPHLPSKDFTSLSEFSDPVIRPPLAQPSPSTFDSLSRPLTPTSDNSPQSPSAPAPPKIELSHPGLSSSSKHSSTLVDKVMPSFDFPSPPPSRAHTPGVPPKRTIVARMSNTASTPSVVPKLAPSFNLPPPPSSSYSYTPTLPPPSGKGSIPSIFAIPPPTNPQPQTTLSSASQTSSKLGLFDDDDFADFSSPLQAKPSVTRPSASMYDSGFSSSSSSNQGLFPTSSTASTFNDFDDFDDFVSSPVRSPSPPRPPSKPLSFTSKPMSTGTSPRQQQGPPPVRISRAADHQRTLSLVETAAARRGMWPAPPSPLPDALPPPASSPSQSMKLDIFGGDNNDASVTQSKQARSLDGLAPSASSPAILSAAPQLNGNGMNARNAAVPPPLLASMQPLSLTPPPMRALPSSGAMERQQPARQPVLASVPASPPPPPKKTGGLSAQDLSFFEGL